MRPHCANNERIVMSIAIDESAVIQYNEQEAARLLGLSRKTLQKFRLTGEGPRYVRVSARCVRYRLVDLRTWQESKLVSSTSEPCPGDVSEPTRRARRVK